MNSETTEARVKTPARNYSAKRSRHHIDFFCQAPEAKQVAISGEFDHWKPEPMQRGPDGYWRIGLELKHGHHQYVFLVDGVATLDPKAQGISRNERNEKVSLVAIS
jgi:1,4-alpha-glucan branching enzyme